MNNEQFQSYDDFKLMTFVYYWMFELYSTVGYGDFAGGTKYEYSFTLLLEFIGILIFSSITILSSNVMARQFDYEKFLSDKVGLQAVWMLKLEFSSRKSLDPRDFQTIRKTILTSLEYDYNTILEEADFFGELPQKL